MKFHGRIGDPAVNFSLNGSISCGFNPYAFALSFETNSPRGCIKVWRTQGDGRDFCPRRPNARTWCIPQLQQHAVPGRAAPRILSCDEVRVCLADASTGRWRSSLMPLLEVRVVAGLTVCCFWQNGTGWDQSRHNKAGTDHQQSKLTRHNGSDFVRIPAAINMFLACKCSQPAVQCQRATSRAKQVVRFSISAFAALIPCPLLGAVCF